MIPHYVSICIGRHKTVHWVFGNIRSKTRSLLRPFRWCSVNRDALSTFLDTMGQLWHYEDAAKHKQLGKHPQEISVYQHRGNSAQGNEEEPSEFWRKTLPCIVAFRNDVLQGIITLPRKKLMPGVQNTQNDWTHSSICLIQPIEISRSP